MKRAIAILGLTGQVAVLAIQLHCPMAGMAGHTESEVTVIAHVQGPGHDHGVAAAPVAAVQSDDQPVTSLEDCVMASGCLVSTAVLAREPRTATPTFAVFDAPATIVTIESAIHQHTTPPPRRPVLFA